MDFGRWLRSLLNSPLNHPEARVMSLSAPDDQGSYVFHVAGQFPARSLRDCWWHQISWLGISRDPKGSQIATLCLQKNWLCGGRSDICRSFGLSQGPRARAMAPQSHIVVTRIHGPLHFGRLGNLVVNSSRSIVYDLPQVRARLHSHQQFTNKSIGLFQCHVRQIPSFHAWLSTCFVVQLFLIEHLLPTKSLKRNNLLSGFKW